MTVFSEMNVVNDLDRNNFNTVMGGDLVENGFMGRHFKEMMAVNMGYLKISDVKWGEK